MNVLFEIHRGLGYVVLVALIVVAGIAFSRAKSSREFSRAPFAIAVGLLDLQVLIGLLFYGLNAYWQSDSALLAFVHPLLMILALVAAHIGVSRARKEQMVDAAHRMAGRALAIATLLVIAGIAVASTGGMGM